MLENKTIQPKEVFLHLSMESSKLNILMNIIYMKSKNMQNNSPYRLEIHVSL